jgi:hypothetical protein
MGLRALVGVIGSDRKGPLTGKVSATFERLVLASAGCLEVAHHSAQALSGQPVGNFGVQDQTSVCSAISSASSTSVPRWRKTRPHWGHAELAEAVVDR